MARRRRAGSLHRSDSAVSSVVGTTLMLAITVSVFAGFSVVVMSQADGDDAPVRADLRLLSGDELVLQHRGGEPLALEDGRLVLNVDGTQVTVPLTALTGQGIEGTDWNAGESVCVSCMYPGQSVRGTFLVAHNTLLVSDGDPGQAPPTGTDLAPGTPTLSPGTPVAGQNTTLTFPVRNLGTDAAAATVLRITLDGAPLADLAVPALAGGATAQASTVWNATAGNHNLTATADADGTVSETDETNNVATLTFTAELPADPGFPFVDMNGDGLYDPAVDTAINTTQIQSGTYDAGAGSLVIPPSIGNITAFRIDFQAGGDVVISVNLTSTNKDIRLQAGGNATLAGITLTQPGKDVDIQAAGWIDVSNGTLDGKKIELTADGGIYAWGATMTSRNQDLLLTATGDIDVRYASLDASASNQDILLTVGSADQVLVQGATFLDRNDKADITPNGVAVGTPTSGGLE